MKMIQRIQKMLALMAALFCVFSLTACEEGSLTAGKILPNECVVKTHYDYGMHRQGKAVLLYNSCTPFFELPEGMDYAIAGDRFTLTYTGEMLTLDSYPGTVMMDDGAIRSVRVQKAVILPLTYRIEGNTAQFFNASGEAVHVETFPEWVVTDPQAGTFLPLAEIADGTLLYAGYDPVDGCVGNDGGQELYTFAALFTQSPR